MAATWSSAQTRVTGSIWGDEMRPHASPGSGSNTSRGLRTTPLGIPQEFHIGTPDLSSHGHTGADGTSQDIWKGAWREAVRSEVADIWGTDSATSPTTLATMHRRAGSATANLPVVRRDLEAVEDLCTRLEARQLSTMKVHSERIMEVIVKPIETKISSLEAKQPTLEWQLTDLSGTLRALGEQVQLQRRASDAVEAALVRWRKQLESENQAKYDELRQEIHKTSDSLRQEQRALAASAPKQQGDCVTHQELAEEAGTLRQEMRLLVDGAAIEKTGVTRQELNSTVELLKQELRLELRHFIDAAASGEKSSGDLHGELDTLREEISGWKARAALSHGGGRTEVEPVLQLATERAERAAERAAQRAAEQTTANAMDTFMEEFRIRGTAISDSTNLEMQRNVSKLEAQFDRWQAQVDNLLRERPSRLSSRRPSGDYSHPGHPEAPPHDHSSGAGALAAAEQAFQEVAKVKRMVSAVVQSTAAGIAECDQKVNDAIADVSKLASFTSDLSHRVEALGGGRPREVVPLHEHHPAAEEESHTTHTAHHPSADAHHATSDLATHTAHHTTSAGPPLHATHLSPRHEKHDVAPSQARLNTLMAENDALIAKLRTDREAGTHSFTPEEGKDLEIVMSEARSIFHRLDVDHSNSLSKSELIDGLKKSELVRHFFGLPAEESQDLAHSKQLDEIFHDMDKDHDESVSLEELECWIKEHPERWHIKKEGHKESPRTHGLLGLLGAVKHNLAHKLHLDGEHQDSHGPGDHGHEGHASSGGHEGHGGHADHGEEEGTAALETVMQEARSVFTKLDVDNSNSIDKMELIAGLKCSATVREFFGLPPPGNEDPALRKRIDDLFNDIDKDHDQTVSWEELACWIKEHPENWHLKKKVQKEETQHAHGLLGLLGSVKHNLAHKLHLDGEHGHSQEGHEAHGSHEDHGSHEAHGSHEDAAHTLSAPRDSGSFMAAQELRRVTSALEKEHQSMSGAIAATSLAAAAHSHVKPTDEAAKHYFIGEEPVRHLSTDALVTATRFAAEVKKVSDHEAHSHEAHGGQHGHGGHVKEFSAEQQGELKAAFDIFDSDGSGSIDREEMEVMLKSMGFHDLTKEDVAKMITEADEDGDGEIEFPEFLKMMASQRKFRDAEAVSLAKRSIHMAIDAHAETIGKEGHDHGAHGHQTHGGHGGHAGHGDDHGCCEEGHDHGGHGHEAHGGHGSHGDGHEAHGGHGSHGQEPQQSHGLLGLLGSVKHNLAHKLHMDGEHQESSHGATDHIHAEVRSVAQQEHSLHTAPAPPTSTLTLETVCSCGHPFSDGDVFCLKCGKKRGMVQAHPPVSAPRHEAPEVTTTQRDWDFDEPSCYPESYTGYAPRSLSGVGGQAEAVSHVEETLHSQATHSEAHAVTTMVTRSHTASSVVQEAHGHAEHSREGHEGHGSHAAQSSHGGHEQEDHDVLQPRHRHSLFSRMDLDHDGVITRDELDAALRSGVIYQPAQASPKRAAAATPSHTTHDHHEEGMESAEENFNSCSDDDTHTAQSQPGLVSSIWQRVRRTGGSNTRQSS